MSSFADNIVRWSFNTRSNQNDESRQKLSLLIKMNENKHNTSGQGECEVNKV